MLNSHIFWNSVLRNETSVILSWVSCDTQETYFWRFKVYVADTEEIHYEDMMKPQETMISIATPLSALSPSALQQTSI